MTQTNTEYLLQVTTPVTDRTYGATNAGEGVGKFDDHLSQASSLSGDDSRTRRDATRYERDDKSWNSGAYSGHDSGNSTPSQTSPADQGTSSDGVCGSTSSGDNAHGDDHDADKSDDTTAAEAAGASQATKDNSAKSDSKSDANANTNTSATDKAAAVNKKAAAEAGDRKAAGIADGQATSSSSSDVLKKQGEEAALLATNVTTDVAETSEEAVESPATTSDGKQSKAAKGNASTANENKEAGASKDGAVGDDQLVGGTGSGNVASAVAKKASESVEASATLKDANSTKGKSDGDESSDDDSRAGTRNDAMVPSNKVDAAQLAGGIPGTTDASGNASSKGKDNEQATKPIAAKGEPVAAAFARMARNSVSGSLDSQSGANDMPQVDPSRFIGRVAKAFQTAQDRGGTLQLRLSPPELGAMRIELSVKDGVMSASLQTETANARRLLLDHLPALRDRLAEQNIRVDRFDVDVRREGTGGQTDARGSQQQQFQHQPDQPAPRRPMQPQQAAAPTVTATGPGVTDAGLNLII